MSVFCLPLHTSHMTQPLDSSCFGALKRAWKSATSRVIYQLSAGINIQAHFLKGDEKVLAAYNNHRIVKGVYFQNLVAGTSALLQGAVVPLKNVKLHIYLRTVNL